MFIKLQEEINDRASNKLIKEVDDALAPLKKLINRMSNTNIKIHMSPEHYQTYTGSVVLQSIKNAVHKSLLDKYTRAETDKFLNDIESFKNQSEKTNEEG